MHDTTSRLLKACPDKPNCVCSCANPNDDVHFVEPFQFGSIDHPLEHLRDLVASFPRVTIVNCTDNYLHAEFRSLIFRFTDDVEFLIDSESRLIHVRSASRVGHSDLGANRKRVEQIRKKWSSVSGDGAGKAP